MVFPSILEKNRFQLKQAGVLARAGYQNYSNMHSSQHMYRQGSVPTCAPCVPKVSYITYLVSLVRYVMA